MNGKVVRWNVLVIAYKHYRFVSASKEPTSANIARRNLTILEHTNRKLQDLWMNASFEERFAFSFDQTPADSKEDAEAMKTRLMSDYKSAGLSVLNAR